MPITYNAGTNIITVTGYTVATPCTFLDLYTADIAGGWGVITRQCTNQYCLSAQIDIGDGSTATYFGDENVSVTFADFVPNSVYDHVRIRNNGHARFGKKISGTRTRNGCFFRMLNISSANRTIFGNFPDYPNNYGDLELYSCVLIGMKATYPGNWGVWILNNFTAYNTTFSGCGIDNIANIDVQDVYVNGAAFGFILIRDQTPTIENCKFHDITPYDGIYFSATYGSMTVKNCDLKNCAYDIYHHIYAAGNHLYCINVTVDRAWHFRYGATSGAERCYRQYELNLKVTDKDENALLGVAVKIWDKDNNLVVDTTTNASGIIATQTLNYGYYYKATGDTPTMQTPHTIEISKARYQTYKKKFTVDEKINWRIRLLQSNPVQFLDNAPILQLCPESQEDDRILYEVV